MENKKGNGIFLGIVSIATLIVAIIGATFAYFSASTQSEEDAVNLQAYEFNLGLSVSPVFPDGASKIIPLDPDKIVEGTQEGEDNRTNLEYALNRATNPCIDDNGLQVCAVYRVEITNNATNEVTLTGQIRTVTNEAGTGDNATAFTNLTYQSVSSASKDPETNRDLLVLPTSDNAVGAVTLAADVDGIVSIDDIVVPGAETVDGELVPGVGVGFILVYLNDNEDQSAEMGASYTGQLIYTSNSGTGNTLTGTFKVSGSATE